jgi:DNA-binding protein YbaB
MDHPSGRDRLSIEQIRDDAVDQIMRAERRMQVTVDAVDEFAIRAREFGAALARKELTEEITPGLGIVVVMGSGELKDVQLNADSVRTSDPARLGQRILDALNRAETKVRLIRERGLHEISQSIQTVEE